MRGVNWHGFLPLMGSRQCLSRAEQGNGVISGHLNLKMASFQPQEEDLMSQPHSQFSVHLPGEERNHNPCSTKPQLIKLSPRASYIKLLALRVQFFF